MAGIDKDFMEKSPKLGVLQKKVLGIKVLYLAIVFVAIIGIYAIKVMRDSKSDVADASSDNAISGQDVPNLSTDFGTDYTALATDGTVYAPATPVDTDPAEPTNEEWAASVIENYSQKGYSATSVQTAVQKYLNGDDLSFQQKELIDSAVKDYGTAPDLNQVGKTATFVGKPGAPTGSGVKDVKRNGFTVVVGSAPSNGSKVDKYQAQVSWNKEFTVTDKMKSDTNRTIVFDDLKPGHGYNVRTRVHNGKGWGPWSAVFKGTTKG